MNPYEDSVHLIPVILCGGTGSRLWPVSREGHPKPFIRLADHQSLLQKTFLRAALLPGVEEILTITNRELLFKMADEFREVNDSGVSTSFILEPFGRNTAAVVAAAGLHLAERYGENVTLLVLAADHLISDHSAFADAVEQALELAKAGKIVTFGIQPDSPETGYGYIEANGNTVLRFIEKPPLERAIEYLESDRFLWNSGIFCFKAGVLLAEMARHCPEILAATRDCLESSQSAEGKGFTQIELDSRRWNWIQTASIVCLTIPLTMH